jgi:G3E family GTPase
VLPQRRHPSLPPPLLPPPLLPPPLLLLWLLLLPPPRHVFQGVHQLLQFSSSAQGAGRSWGPNEERVCKLVFIGRNLDRKELNDGFAACLAPKA